jgi:hypothetical protein
MRIEGTKRNRQGAVRSATRATVTTVGVLFGIAGFNHGFFEFLQGNTPTGGLVIQAIGEAQRFWNLGTEEAFTVLPTFQIAGLISMALAVTIVAWSLFFIGTRPGPAVFLVLFSLLFLSGGGIGQLAFFLPAWAFSTRMGRPLAWWGKLLAPRARACLSGLWPVMLALSSALALAGLEIAIFGLVPGISDAELVQNTALLLMLASAVGYVVTFIAGFGRDLKRGAMHRGGSGATCE